jgi:hypothetical protein
MRRFVCWYAYQGHETEGSLNLLEPQRIQAEDIHDAVWKYFEIQNKRGYLGNLKEIYGSLDEYRKKCEEPLGWGLNCEELK